MSVKGKKIIRTIKISKKHEPTMTKANIILNPNTIHENQKQHEMCIT
jgi:hypothetical protein